MKTLIVNADDYGLHPDASRGIRTAHRTGIVSSSTVMMTFPTALADMTLADRETPNLGLGVHLCLTAGEPVLPKSEIPTLLTADGEFYKSDNLQALHQVALHQQLAPAQLYAECKAQIERFRKSGLQPTHLDSHHHALYWSAPALRVLCQLASEYRIPIRNPHAIFGEGLGFNVDTITPAEVEAIMAEFKVKTTDVFVDWFYGDVVSVETLVNILETQTADSVEIMCHPAHWSQDLEAISSYTKVRQLELDVLTNPAVSAAVIANGWALEAFDHL